MAIIKIKNQAIDLDAAEIPNLPATKITSGTFDNARISLDAAEIPNLDTAKITTGTLADARVPDLNASKITAGTIATARLGSGTASSSTFLRGDNTFAEAGGGKILNVYQVSYDTTISTTSNSYQTTNLTKTLTPSSTSSDFLIQFNFGVQKIQSASSSSQYVRLKKGSTVLKEWSEGWMLYEATGGGSRGYPPGHFIHVDQPATTSAITYSVEYKSEQSGAISGSEGNKTMIIWEIEGVS